MKRRLSGTKLSSENNLPMFRLNAPVWMWSSVGACIVFVADTECKIDCMAIGMEV